MIVLNRPATLQDNLAAAKDPAAICSFDYEAILSPTKPLIHQAARFLYFKRGRGVIDIGGVEYDIKPNTLIAITPWKISEITAVKETLQFMRIVYDYQYINSVLKGVPGSEEDSSELLQFLSMEPVVYLDSVQAQYMDGLTEQLKAELGVESTRVSQPDRPMAQLYVTNKIIELMIMYRRYIMAVRGEKDYEKDISTQNSILSYIYAHSSEMPSKSPRCMGRSFARAWRRPSSSPSPPCPKTSPTSPAPPFPSCSPASASKRCPTI